MFKNLIRYAAYLIVLGLSLLAVLLSIENEIPPWPSFVIISALGLFAVASLERIQPYERPRLAYHFREVTS